MLEGGTDAVGASGVLPFENGSGSTIALDGRFFDHKMCRIFSNIRNFETGIPSDGFSYIWLSPGTSLVVRIPFLSNGPLTKFWPSYSCFRVLASTSARRPDFKPDDAELHDSTKKRQTQQVLEWYGERWR